MSLVSCSIDDDAMSRGRIPAHHVLDYYKMLSLTITRNNKNRIKKRKQLGRRRIIRKNNTMKYEDILYKALLFHHYSYDKSTRPSVEFNLPPLLQPVEVLSKYDFYNNTGFWPNQFQEIMNELKLIPNTFIHRKTRCKATKELSLYILLRRWRKADNW